MRILSNLKSFHNYFTEPTRHRNVIWKVSCSEHTRFIEIDLDKMYKRFPYTKLTPLTDWVSRSEFLSCVQELKIYEVSAKGELYVQTYQGRTGSIRFWRITNV